MTVLRSPFTVYKLDYRGREVLNYPGHLLHRTPNLVCLEAFFSRDDMDLGYAVFKRRDRFVETFYRHRWYNIFAIYDRDNGGHKGWYCNVCRPARISSSAVWCEDLALDLWVSPDRRDVRVLDEEEFAALPIPPRDRQAARAALAALLKAAAVGALPR